MTKPVPAARPARPGNEDDVVLALDIGATRIKAALISADGQRQAVRISDTQRTDGPSAVLRRVGDVAAELIASAGSAAGPNRGLAPDAVRAGGAAVCGTVDQAGLVESANLGWHRMDLGSALSGRLGFPVTIINDAHAGAIGEGSFGAAGSLRDYLYVALGTGIGAAIVLDGHVVEGAHGHAGELGHIEVERPGRACACGSCGCLETIMSAAAIEARWSETYDAPLSAREIVDRVISGDPAAEKLWSEAIDALADGLLTFVSLIDPGAMVLGGGLSNAGEHLVGPLDRSMRARARSFHIPAELRLATLGDWSACAGAAVQARARFLSTVPC
jgi:glucokinase